MFPLVKGDFDWPWAWIGAWITFSTSATMILFVAYHYIDGILIPSWKDTREQKRKSREQSTGSHPTKLHYFVHSVNTVQIPRVTLGNQKPQKNISTLRIRALQQRLRSMKKPG